MSLVKGNPPKKVAELSRKFNSLTTANQQEICSKMNENFSLSRKLTPNNIVFEEFTVNQKFVFEELVQHYIDNTK